MNKKYNFMVTFGIVGLLFVVFGITFAFFNYNRTGSSNIIKVGRISFNSEQGNSINLTNVFPIDKANLNTDTDNVGSVAIHITGDTTYTEGIEYLVTASNVSNSVGNKKIPLSVDVSYEASNNKSIGTSDNNYFDNRGGNTSLYKVLAGKTVNEGNKLVVGYIKPDQVGIDGTITIKAFIDKDKIAISDTYPEGSYSETIGEDTYQVKSNLSESELNICIGNMAYLDPSAQATYTIKNNPDENAINSCVSFFGDMNVPLGTGESYNSFCRGEGTMSGIDLQTLVNYDAYTSELANMGILDVSYTNIETIENFCRGTETIDNQSFQQMIDSGDISQYTIDSLKNGNVIIQTGYQITNTWTNGTTNAWVNNRTVLTTEEWNSLQQDGISFQVKVEANEGIWVDRQGNAMKAFPSNMFPNDVSSNIKELYFNNISKNTMIERYNSAIYKADITDDNEGEVLTWLEPDTIDNTKYIMYVASDGETFFPESTRYLFSDGNLSNVEKIEFNNVNTSRVKIMDNMFYYITKLKRIDLSSLDTSNVIEMYDLFYGASNLEYVNMSGLDMQKVQSMNYMFSGCWELTEVDFTGSQTRDVRTMSSMFSSAFKLESVNLDGMGGNNLDVISGMFSSNTIKHISMRNFNFGTARLTGFFQISSLESIDLTNAIINHTNLNNLFSGCVNLTSVTLDNIKIDNVTELAYMFEGCSSLESIDLSTIDFSKINTVYGMFTGCSSLQTIYVASNFNIDHIISSNTTNMFDGCISLVGGNGTTYDANYIDNTYARIDGGQDNPGYLTLKIT